LQNGLNVSEIRDVGHDFGAVPGHRILKLPGRAEGKQPRNAKCWAATIERSDAAQNLDIEQAKILAELSH
jgi:hypothetical protein